MATNDKQTCSLPSLFKPTFPKYYYQYYLDLEFSSKLVKIRAQSTVREFKMLAVWSSNAEGFLIACSRVTISPLLPQFEIKYKLVTGLKPSYDLKIKLNPPWLNKEWVPCLQTMYL